MLSLAGWFGIAIFVKTDVFDGFNNFLLLALSKRMILLCLLMISLMTRSHSHAVADFCFIGDADFKNPVIPSTQAGQLQ